MEYIEPKYKLVAVLNKKIEIGRAMNALAHMAVGIGGSTKSNLLRLQDYHDADGEKHPSISDIPFIVLRANSSQIQKLREIAKAESFLFTNFTDTMLGETYVDQHAKTSLTKAEDLQYFGICLFGESK